MFNNANVLFRTRFVDGTSMVTRYGLRDGEARASLPQAVGTAPSPLAERDVNSENPQDPGTAKGRRNKRKQQDAEEEEQEIGATCTYSEFLSLWLPVASVSAQSVR